MPSNETVSDAMEMPSKKEDEEDNPRRSRLEMINPQIGDFVSDIQSNSNVFFWANEEILDFLKIQVLTFYKILLRLQRLYFLVPLLIKTDITVKKKKKNLLERLFPISATKLVKKKK